MKARSDHTVPLLPVCERHTTRAVRNATFQWVAQVVLSAAAGPMVHDARAQGTPGTGIARVSLIGEAGVGSIARAGPAVIVEPGVLYVADALDHDVKVFDLRTGQHVRTFARSGRGPGELRYPLTMRATDSTIVIRDAQNGSVEISFEGRHVSTMPNLNRSLSRTPESAQRLRFGWTLVTSTTATRDPRLLDDNPVIRRAILVHARFAADTLAEVQGDVLRVRWPGGTSTTSAGFGDSGDWAVIDDSVVVVADGYASTVRWFAIGRERKTLVRTATLGREARTVTPLDIERQSREVLSLIALSARGLSPPKEVTLIAPPTLWSTASRIVVGGGTVVVGAPRPVREVRAGQVHVSYAENTWTLFRPDGSVARFTLPPTAALLAVSSGFVVAAPTDGETAGVLVFEMERR